MNALEKCSIQVRERVEVGYSILKMGNGGYTQCRNVIANTRITYVDATVTCRAFVIQKQKRSIFMQILKQVCKSSYSVYVRSERTYL